MDVNGLITKVTWRIENFSSIKGKKLYSENFTVDGNKWRLHIHTKGIYVDHWLFFCIVPDSATMPLGGSAYAQIGLAVINQFDRKTSITKVGMAEFKVSRLSLDLSSLLALREFQNPKRGYLVNDVCLLEAYVSTDRTEGLISHEFMIETDSDRHKTDEADSPTHPSEQSVLSQAFEPADPTEEDMITFFTSLESELSNSNIVFSQEEAKKALATLEEALDRNPTRFYGSREFTSLELAFKILASFYCPSTVEQKKELLAMLESLKELADRAAKAMQDKNCLAEKESFKLTTTHKLGRNLIRYKEVESEVAVLHVQVEEAEKKMKNILAERKEIFKSSKKMKMELEALEKKWAEYEAMAKVAEEEERSVEAEWGRIKDFISSINRKI
ncbi:hypothetical protein Goklo_005020 [Gossypium klotzschianum]|uniref:MATH domain-containing protein n=1 Tax=Gossypium klotzschianum TaxID=34286 RepID=A0A7J8VR73_9ROSI|nr:hypothetical protein [Gossypium klotzschianum]